MEAARDLSARVDAALPGLAGNDRVVIAQRCESDYARMRVLRGDSASAVDVEQSDRRRAWVTLLTNASYAGGVKALHNSLAACDSEYSLVVMFTDGVPADVQASLADHGCELLHVEVLPLPSGTGDRDAAYSSAHFAECWTKLRLWEQEQYEAIVYLDADMVILKNIDELLEHTLVGGCPASQACHIRAVHECFCAVKRGDVPCAYIQQGTSKPSAPPPTPHERSYFNAGLFVMRPSRVVFEHMVAALAGFDLSSCPFAEQDFLNAYFKGSWEALPWVFNATKTLYACHREHVNGCRNGLWVLQSVRNLHFTMAKPWNLKDPGHQGFERLNKLWWAAYAEPQALGRVLLQVHMQEKKAAAARAPPKDSPGW